MTEFFVQGGGRDPLPARLALGGAASRRASLRLLLSCTIAGAGGLAGAIAQAAAPEILIGQTAGFTGSAAAGVAEITEGARLWFDAVNRKGGVNGQLLKLISLDDRFDPATSAENARTLIEQKGVLAMFLTRGTPHTEAVIPLLERHGVPLVAPSTGAMSLNQPVRKYVFNVRAPYQQEAEKSVRHLYSLGIRRIAVVHADDTFGTDALEGANRVFMEVKASPVRLIKADRDRPALDRIIPELASADAQAVLWIGSAKVVSDGVRMLRAAGRKTQVITLSNNASAGFVKALGADARGVMVSQVFPSERSLSYGLVREALELARQGGVNVSPATLEGFAAAKVLVEGLRRAGKSPTRATVLAGLEGINGFDLGGFKISYSRDKHTGLSFADLSIIDESGRFVR